MKVFEENTDRHAEVHLHIEGQIEPLDEYGEWVDKDGAICCFVGLKTDERVNLKGKLSGTMLSAQYDFVIDGVLRKSVQHIGRSTGGGSFKNKKLDTDKFLFQTGKGVIDTEIIVRELPNDIKILQSEPSAIGTIEMRVSVLRQPNTEHSSPYYPTSFDVEGDQYDKEKPMGFVLLPPDLSMTFQENSKQPLEQRTVKRAKKTMSLTRPGKEIWAIFRFHYRKHGRPLLVHQRPDTDVTV